MGIPGCAGALAACLILATPQPPDKETGGFEPGSRQHVEAAVRRGLAWLHRHQTSRGAWAGDVGHKQGDDYVIMADTDHQIALNEGHVGVTALAAMAFLAEGSVPGRGDYGPVVDRALDYLLDSCKVDGYITATETRMYSHSFATLFLAEVYGMTRRRDLTGRIQDAVDLVIDAQNEQGGWRYNPYVKEADLSVTVCQLQALRAARNVGIRVPRSTIDRAVDYVQRSRIGRGRYAGAYFYKIAGRSARTKTSYTVNAAAVTALTSAGFYDFDAMEGAIRFIENHYDDVSRYDPNHFYYWYGNYYAAQAMFQVGGARWDRYYERLKTDLLARQRPDGSWANDVGPGPAFGTAVAWHPAADSQAVPPDLPTLIGRPLEKV